MLYCVLFMVLSEMKLHEGARCLRHISVLLCVSKSENRCSGELILIKSDFSKIYMSTYVRCYYSLTNVTNNLYTHVCAFLVISMCTFIILSENYRLPLTVSSSSWQRSLSTDSSHEGRSSGGN